MRLLPMAFNTNNDSARAAKSSILIAQKRHIAGQKQGPLIHQSSFKSLSVFVTEQLPSREALVYCG